jgi:serine/threonine-protein kinase RsbW
MPFRVDDEVFRADLPSRLSARETVIDSILERLEARGCEPDRFLDRLCLDEAISNAIVHGNREDPTKKVRIRVFCSQDRWGVEVCDEGCGFDWKSELRRTKNGPDPDDPSGLGLAILRASSADLQFYDGGRRVLLVRSRR